MKAISMLRSLLPGYHDPVPLARRPANGRIPPLERPAALDAFEGQWVALLRGQVIESANTSSALASKLRSLGPDAQDAVMQFVRPPTAGYVIGVG
jgi:hypothetical protein